MIAQALAANGAKVYIGSRRGEVVEQSAKDNTSKLAGQIVPQVAMTLVSAQCDLHLSSGLNST